MGKRKNISGKAFDFKKYLIFQFINLIIYSVIFIIISCVCVIGDVDNDYMVYVAMIFIGISSFVSAFIIGIKVRRKGLIYGILNPLPLNIILVLVSMAFNGFKVDATLLITAIISLGISAMAGIISVNIRQK